jgi:hypothetical protein
MKDMKWTEHLARMGETRSTYNILVGKPEEKIPLLKLRLR